MELTEVLKLYVLSETLSEAVSDTECYAGFLWRWSVTDIQRLRLEVGCHESSIYCYL